MPESATPILPLALAEIRQLCSSGVAREIREAADLSIADVAGFLGVNTATLSCWERGVKRPTGERALLLLTLLHELRSRPTTHRRARLVRAAPERSPSR